MAALTSFRGLLARRSAPRNHAAPPPIVLALRKLRLLRSIPTGGERRHLPLRNQSTDCALMKSL